MPVSAGKFERDSIGVHPFAERVVRVIAYAEWPEVDVLDMADVVALVHKDSALHRVAGDIADKMARGANEFDPLIWIEQAAVANGDVVGVLGINAGRVRRR